MRTKVAPQSTQSVIPAQASERPVAVLIDGSALFLASPSPEEHRLNYFALMEVLVERVPGLQQPGKGRDSIWAMWTAAEPRNAGQVKFLEFAEQRLHWQVRPSRPAQSFMIEPEALFGIGTTEMGRANRLIRFDAPIAFAMGRLAQTHRLVVITDSYSLFEPMARINENWGAKNGKCVLAFFGQACDMRWRAAFRSPDAPEFIDFDEYQPKLFGIEEREVHSPARQPGPFVF